MLDSDLREELLIPASKLIQETGRSVGSPKRDVNDLKDLEKVLKDISKLLKHVRKIQINRYKED